MPTEATRHKKAPRRGQGGRMKLKEFMEMLKETAAYTMESEDAEGPQGELNEHKMPIL